MRRLPPVAAAVGLLVFLAACTGTSEGASDSTGSRSGSSKGKAPQAQTHSPTDPASVLSATTPVELAAQTATALYAAAPAAVLAPESDLDAQGRAAFVAVRLGAPMLLVPAPPAATGSTPTGTNDSGTPSAGGGRASGTPTAGATSRVSSGSSGSAAAASSPAASSASGSVPARSGAVGSTSGGSAAASPTGGTSPSTAPDPVRSALAELKTRTVVAVGTPAAEYAQQLADKIRVMPAPADASGLADLVGADAATPAAINPDQLLDAVAALEASSESVPTLSASGASGSAASGAGSGSTAGSSPTAAGSAGAARTASASPSAPTQPVGTVGVVPPTPLRDLTVLAPLGDEVALAGVATARAAGATVVMSPADPRAAPATIAALAAVTPTRVLALGDRFGPADQLAEHVEVAETGVQLPGGGQLLFPYRRLVALYGHPGTPSLGVLGEQGVDETIARAKQVAAQYDPYSNQPVIPSLEILATVAAGKPGEDGNYSTEFNPSKFEPLVDAAGKAGMYVILDLQPGRSNFLEQAKLYEDLLKRPYVGLALDPEWKLQPDQVPLKQIGSVGIDEVNSVVTWLADLVRDNKLPQKLFLLHQFRTTMIRDRSQLDSSRDELSYLIQMDGQGAVSIKYDSYSIITADPPPNVFFGWKNFYDEDKPTLSPEKTMQVNPKPFYISYQ